MPEKNDIGFEGGRTLESAQRASIANHHAAEINDPPHALNLPAVKIPARRPAVLGCDISSVAIRKTHFRSKFLHRLTVQRIAIVGLVSN